MSAPLAGVRVVDLTRYLAGPFCTQLLGDYGADVIRVESPRGREFRAPGQTRDAYFFLSANRNKRALALDLAKAEGRAVLARGEEADHDRCQEHRAQDETQHSGTTLTPAWRRSAR